MRRYIRRLFMVMLLIAGSFFVFMAYREYQPFAEAKVKQKALVDTIVIEAEDTPEDPLMRQIDFKALKEINPDIIGWLYIPQIGVDLPVLQGKDNSQYLHVDFEGNASPLGSIFTWADSDKRLSDLHVCLFGHNMRSGQMFGRLHEFEDSGFMEGNRQLYLYTPERSKELEVTSVFKCKMTDRIFQAGWTGEESGQTVTLSTCSGYGGKSGRLVVNCRVARERLVL